MNEREIFIAALEKDTPAERQAYLDQVCRDDTALRERIEGLLDVHDRAGSFLNKPVAAAALTGEYTPVGDQAAASLAEKDALAGKVIGPYKLVEEIGAGGMGTVWMAQQTEPVKRLVALKLIKAGMDSMQVLARFEAERQVLALMDHPNIARVLDAGATATGRPYFVMELVKGVPLTKYCDEHRLTPKQRLDLFIPVCQAIQHAHQKGIIHRDIKPSNVLVAQYDGRPVPKVIDFGIAKAAGQQLTEHTLVTGFGVVVGTLEYMSPEQAELNQLDIDTRSDIYSLGVLLYELLTGSTPLEKKRLKEAALLEVLRIIREEEPPRPSKRLSTTDELPSVASNRNLQPRKLSGLVRGELDWIVMKALEKDRNRRYESATALALDLQRYLADEPVQACPPSLGYRVGKALRKHRATVLTAASLLAVLVLGMIALAVDLRAENRRANAEEGRANAERQRADMEGERAEALRQQAETQEHWQQTAHYLQNALSLHEYRGNNLTRADEILDSCEPSLRRWEWYYLKRLYHSELSSVSVGSRGKGYWQPLVSPDATRVAFLELRNRVHVCDVATGKEVVNFVIKGASVEGRLAFSPDGKRLLTGEGSRDGQTQVRVWDAATGQELATLKGLKGAEAGRTVFGVALSPDGTVVAGGDRKGHLFVWDLATGKERFPHFMPHPIPNAAPNEVWHMWMAFSPDGKRLVTTCQDDHQVKVWNAETGELIRPLEPGSGFSRVAWSSKGRWLAAAGKAFTLNEHDTDPTVRVWDAETGRTKHVLRGHTTGVASLTFSPDERLLATGGDDHTAILWDVATGREFGIYRHNFPVGEMAFSPDSKRLTSLGFDFQVKTWDATRRPENRVLNCISTYRTAVSADGRLVAAGALIDRKSGNQTVVWDTLTGEVKAAFGNRNEMPWGVAFSPDGRRVATAFDIEDVGAVKVWDLTTKQLSRTFPGEGEEQVGPLQVVAYSPDGKLLAGAGVDRCVHVWDAATGAKRFRGTGHLRTVTSLGFSADGERLLSATGGFNWMKSFGKNPLKLQRDNMNAPSDLKIWEVATGKELCSLNLPVRPQGAALRPDGAVVAVTAMDNTVRLYEVPTGKEAGVLKGHTQLGWAVAFSPDGQRVVTAAQDSTIKLWDAKTGEEIMTIGRQQLGVVGSVAFSSDGWKIVSAGLEDIRVWDATPLKK
jgi:WD40 repeat protein/serine/threonine protein kinase